MKKSKKTPSRMKYEQNHRTVSFRTSKEIDDRLQAVKKAEGLSNADILKSALGLIEMKVTNEKEARKQGYAAGFREGFERATNLYRVTYPCKRCGKIIEIKYLRG